MPKIVSGPARAEVCSPYGRKLINMYQTENLSPVKGPLKHPTVSIVCAVACCAGKLIIQNAAKFGQVAKLRDPFQESICDPTFKYCISDDGMQNSSKNTKPVYTWHPMLNETYLVTRR